MVAPASAPVPAAAELAALADAALLEAVQRQTFGYFWEGAEPASALACDRRTRTDIANHKVATGGSGFGVMALIVAVERGWVSRAAALGRLARMLGALQSAPRYHGALPHFLDGRSGETIPFSRRDDGGDLVETSFLCMGLLCARQYFDRDTPAESHLRATVTALWEQVEWRWYTRGQPKLYWHWSPRHQWAIDHAIRGWNECLITYVLAAAAPRDPIDAQVYHEGFAAGATFRNGNRYYGLELPLGVPYGGPLFFTHYSFCGLDPRGLRDRYADYWQQNVQHVRINHAHCVANPNHCAGYGESCWGLTASDDPDGYVAHCPEVDNGTLSPTAALSSFPYDAALAMRTLRHFLDAHGARIWGRYGFVDAFCETRGWYADTFLAIDQGPIVVMIENYRSALLWRLFMSVPEVRAGLRRLGFASPHLDGELQGP
ncbi:MAG TPA: glucoamylase family protein [Steroidobacteraceae bacterium]|nr:glucoamylase family protein [Steroidobacteraceae bacterium]